MSEPVWLTDEQRALLRTVLNRVIPAEGTWPAAGELGIGEAVEAAIASAAARRRWLDGLAAIEITAWRRTDGNFQAQPPEQQDQVLGAVEQAQPEFFDALIYQTYRSYYTHPQVAPRLGLPARPPQPRGYALPAFDPERLAPVRQRGPIWRPVDRGVGE
jgi:hypothetical protein